MQHLRTARDGFGPAGIAIEVGRDEFQVTAHAGGVVDEMRPPAGAGEIAHGAAHRVPVIQ
ncbi:hypothetical protein [Nocardia sp. NPDC002869]|uniref:hypothetical protein n=1 Tax=Nocardia sp. NPDC002869 TaxID=3161032 RepID=UPI00398C8D94